MASNDAPVFEGFPDSTLKFLQDLRKNNDKAWFNEHRADYEAAFKRPAQDFCAAMEERLTELAIMPLNSKVYRVNRDLRFSKDKTPYNTHVHISFRPGTGVSSAPSFAFGLDPKMLTVGAGAFGFEKQLDSYRENMSGDAGDALSVEIGILLKNGARFGAEPELKRVPKPYPSDHPRANLLRRKSLTLWLDFDSPKAASRTNIIEDCLKRFAALLPVYTWLAGIR